MAIYNRNILGYWLLPPGEGTAAYDTVLNMIPCFASWLFSCQMNRFD